MSRFLWVGLFVSVILAFGMSRLRASDLIYDSLDYFAYGQNFAHTGVYGLEPGVPDTAREPGYGIFLGGVIQARALLDSSATQALFPSELSWIVFCQVLLGALCSLFLGSAVSAIGGWGVPLAILCALSPTLLGMHRVILSETLAVSLIMLTLGFSVFGFRENSRLKAAGAGLSFGLACLTKVYFSGLAVLLLATVLVAWVVSFIGKKRLPWVRQLLIPLMICWAVILGWKIRDRIQLPRETSRHREILLFAGKLKKYESMTPADYPVALASALDGTGANGCARKYGEQACSRFGFLNSDHYGFEEIRKFNESGEKSVLVFALKLLGQALTHPLSYLAGTFFEGVKIAFFELDYGLFGILMPQLSSQLHLYSLWHFVGSLVQWGLIFGLCVRGFRRSFSLLTLSASVLVVYHFALMSQLNNLDRYVVPIVPAFYVLSVEGLRVLLGSRRSQAE